MKAASKSVTSLRLVLVCGVLTAFPAMSIDLGLPGFAAMARSLDVSIAHVAQTLSVFFFGFSASPLIYGPLSDRVGRRPVLLGTCLVYAIASVMASMVTSFNALLLCRLLQGAGAGAASVLAITVIRDHHHGAGARRLLSYAAVVRIIAPTTAPSIGNLLLLTGNWRWIYGFMAFGGTLMFLMVLTCLPESSAFKLSMSAGSLSRDPRATNSPARRSALADYRSFLSDRLGISYAMIVALTFGSHFTYITGSVYVFVNQLHMSATAYGFVFGIMALCLMLGSFISGLLSRRTISSDVILGAALCVSVLSSGLTLVLALSHLLTVPVLTVLLSTNTICLGVLTPCAQQGAMENAGKYAGTASALMNALMTGMGALASYVEGVLLDVFDKTPDVIMSVQMLAFCFAALVIVLLVVLPQHLARFSTPIER
jgi:MFS transporter, DHA1 family, multidrug resistance protein